MSDGVVAAELIFIGATLHLRGVEPVVQPLVSASRSVLVYNGNDARELDVMLLPFLFFTCYCLTVMYAELVTFFSSKVRYMEGFTLLMMKMTPELFFPHWNLVAHVTAMLALRIQHAHVVGVLANRFHKSFRQSKDHGL